MYFPSFDAADGHLLRLALVPMRIRRFRLERAADADARWLQEVLSREGGRFGTRVGRDSGGEMLVSWRQAA